MKLTTKSRYGTRAMMDIAIHNTTGSTMLKDIAQRQNISAKYLDHILSSLKKAGLIKNIRGKNKGYYLTRNPDAITVKDIILAVEGSLAPVECVDRPSECTRSETCSARCVWLKVKKTLEEVLEATTLQSLVEQQNTALHVSLNYSI